MNTEIGGVVNVLDEIIKSNDIVEHTIVSLSKSHKNYKHNGKSYFYELNYEFDPSYTGWSYLKTSLFRGITRKKSKELVELIKKINPDVVHFHTNLKELMLGEILKKELPSLKLLVTEHLTRLDNVSNINPISKQMLVYAFREYFKAFHVIGVSNSVINYLRIYKLYNPSNELYLIENSININTFTPITFSDKETISIVYLARINHVKNHKELLQSMKLLSDRKVKLFLAGPDETNGEIHAMSKDLGIEDSVEFMGPVSNIPAVLSKMDIAVFPSSKEGLPVALIEKMAAGLPVIVSDIPELTAIITNNVNGLVYKIGSSSELADKIASLIEDKNLRERLGKAARKYVEEKYNTPLEKKYDEFYNQFLS